LGGRRIGDPSSSLGTGLRLPICQQAFDVSAGFAVGRAAFFGTFRVRPLIFGRALSWYRVEGRGERKGGRVLGVRCWGPEDWRSFEFARDGFAIADWPRGFRRKSRIPRRAGSFFRDFSCSALNFWARIVVVQGGGTRGKKGGPGVGCSVLGAGGLAILRVRSGRVCDCRLAKRLST